MATSEVADAVVVLPHWGTRHTHTPEPIQREVARELVAAGAFDRGSREQALEGVVLETTWWDDELKAFRLVPYAMDPVDHAPRAITGDRAADVLGYVWGASTGPFRAG